MFIVLCVVVVGANFGVCGFSASQIAHCVRTTTSLSFLRISTGILSCDQNNILSFKQYIVFTFIMIILLFACRPMVVSICKNIAKHPGIDCLNSTTLTVFSSFDSSF